MQWCCDADVVLLQARAHCMFRHAASRALPTLSEPTCQLSMLADLARGTSWCRAPYQMIYCNQTATAEGQRSDGSESSSKVAWWPWTVFGKRIKVILHK